MSEASPADVYRSIPYLVVRIVGEPADGGPARVGTGFFYQFILDDEPNQGASLPLVVSNKHVLGGMKTLHFDLPTVDASGRRHPGPPNRVSAPAKGIIEHPDPDVDIAAFPVFPEFGGRGVQLVPDFILSSRNVADRWTLENASAIETVIMVGFPDGIMDEVNNLPVVRRGITATPLNNDYDGRPDFALDIAVYGGSSGSPIFLVREGFTRTQSGQLVLLQEPEAHLVGILHSGHFRTQTGEIKRAPVPTASSEYVDIPQMVNVGVCARAELLHTLLKTSAWDDFPLGRAR